MASLTDRVRRLEDQADLSRLIATYCLAIDDRDLDAVAGLYTQDGVFAGNASGAPLVGIERILEYFRARWSEGGWTNHFVHTQIVDFLSPDQAVGRVTGHAEHAYRATYVVAATRYHDHYVRGDDGWRFRRRVAKVFYLMPMAELPRLFNDEKRKRWPEREPQVAELPEPPEAYAHFREDVRSQLP